MSELNSKDIKAVVSETIKEVHEAQAIQLKKPQTLQGWFYVTMALGTIIAVLWSSIVFLNDIAEHQKTGSHVSTNLLLEKINQNHEDHVQDQEHHRREEELQLQILEETKPIQEDLRIIQTNQENFRQDVRDVRQDVRDVQQSINALSEKIGSKANK